MSNWFEFDESANVWSDPTDDYRPPPWRIVAVPEVLTWLNALAASDANLERRLIRTLSALKVKGPLLGRPMADHVKGSTIRNLKELRCTADRKEIFRILFVFDPTRSAVLLVGGDKAGQWNKWYPRAIRLAEQRYAQHLALQKRRRS